MLIIQVEHGGKRETHLHNGGPVVIGRVPEGTERFIPVLDQYVSGRHLLLEELPRGRVRIQVLGRNGVRLSDGRQLEKGEDAEARLPFQMDLTTTLISVRAKANADDGANVYASVPKFDQTVTRLALMPEAPSVEQLAGWFETLLSVQRSAVGSEKFYEETAQALVDLIGMDRGLVLLRDSGQWAVAAARSVRKEREPSYSTSILAKVVSEARTVTSSPRGSEPLGESRGSVSASLRILEAAVGAPIFDPAGEVVGMLYGSRDYVTGEPSTAIQPLEAQLVQLLASSVTTGLNRMGMLDRLRQAEQLAAVGQALGYILHDLRGPLGNAQQLTEMLRGPEPSNLSREQQLDFIDESLAISLELLNDSLEFCRGRIQLDLVEGNCRDLLDKYLRALAMKLDALGVVLQIDIPDALTVTLDPARISRVIYNIAKNAAEALQGRADGEVVVCARKQEDGALLMSISDNGGGLPEAVQANLFQPFGTHGKRGGTGFGLAIAKQLVDAHRGTIDVATGPAGTTFKIMLPVRECDTKVVASEDKSLPAARTGEPAGERVHVLLAEDGLVNQALIGGLLREAGCAFKIVSNGALAIDAWESGAFDLILMDIEMPEMGGLEATRKIRERERNAARKTPIVALTAHQADESRSECLASGMDDYLVKPLKGEAIDRLMNEILAPLKR